MAALQRAPSYQPGKRDAIAQQNVMVLHEPHAIIAAIARISHHSDDDERHRKNLGGSSACIQVHSSSTGNNLHDHA